MALPYFYSPELMDGITTIALDENNSKHVVQVLRMKNGDWLQLTNGKGMLAEAEIASANKKTCEVKILATKYSLPAVDRKVGIAISPVKNASRFEWFLEKATELGVAHIYPMLCHRTEREHFRHDRMNSICISAMLQSQQTWLPVLHPPMPFELLVNTSNQEFLFDHRWIAHCDETRKHPLVQVIKPEMKDGLILIGPEGDFIKEEIDLALEIGFVPVSLGSTRLRTETAGMVAATLLLHTPFVNVEIS